LNQTYMKRPNMQSRAQAGGADHKIILRNYSLTGVDAITEIDM